MYEVKHIHTMYHQNIKDCSEVLVVNNILNKSSSKLMKIWEIIY